jgi:ketosteroid isomerase-like protein
VGDADALLAANAAFYAAFNARDAEAMANLWATDDSVCCIHPGWSVLSGREQVLSSWREIFAAGTTPTVTCRQPQAIPFADGGLVICYEAVGDQLLAATNVFRREDGGLRLLHHQAGPCATGPEADTEATRH